MEKYFDILKKCKLFSGISDDSLAKMLPCLNVTVKKVKKNCSVLNEGDVAKSLGIVLSGSVMIVRDDIFGNRSIIEIITAPNLFAEVFALSETDVLPVGVIAAEDCEVMLINRDRIACTCDNACVFHRKAILNLMENVAEKNLLLNRKNELLSKRSTREKIMTYLLWQAKIQGASAFFIPYTRQELADYLNVERSALSAEIGKLRNDGVLVSNRKYFKLL